MKLLISNITLEHRASSPGERKVGSLSAGDISPPSSLVIERCGDCGGPKVRQKERERERFVQKVL